MIGCATGIGIGSSAIGIIVSYHLSTPTGPTIILTAGVMYLISLLIGLKNGLLLRLIPRKHFAA